MVKDIGFEWSFSPLQFETELLLQRREESQQRLKIGISAFSRLCLCRASNFLGRLSPRSERIPLQLDIEVTRHTRLIQHRPIRVSAQHQSQVGHVDGRA
jgi:hypothetical protein